MPRKNVSTQLSLIKDRLDEAGVRWAVFAGAAAHCYGSKIEVTDVDILVANADLDKAKAVLKDVDLEGFDVAAGSDIPTPQGVCCFFLDDEAMKRVQRKQLFGVTVPVISVEDNIVFKAILQRGKEEGKRDVEHIRDMVKHEKIDLEYLRDRIQQCHANKRVMPLLKSLIPHI